MTPAIATQSVDLPDTDQQLINSLLTLSEKAPVELKEQLSHQLLKLKKEIDTIRASNTTMAEAQAKALVNSAMVMSELKETHRELDKARGDAVSASAAKSEFLANMSHEIRTPINGVLGMNEILLRSDLSPTQRRCATVIRNSVEALLQIINDILDFSKIEAGKFELVSAPFNLRDVVEDVVQLFAENAQRKGLELNVVADAGTEIHFIGDAGRIRQVLANLVGNAIKFTETGEIVVRFDTSRRSDGNYHARFEVEDTGIGIDPDVQTKIFESFTQADSSTERRFGGTGLGLSICSQLVHLMGGKIAVKSNPTAGSNFYFDIQMQADESNRGLCDNEVAQLKNVKVLAVDDTETNRIIYGDQLNHWQCDFALAASGPEALRMLEEAHDDGKPFEIIILDMHMPEMDGLNLARRITQDPRNKKLTRIMLSSIGDQLSQTIDPSVNIHIYMTKPVRYRELQDCLCDVKSGRVAQGFNLSETQAQKFSGHVLVAEDNLVNQEVAIDLLELNNLTVDAVSNGEEALEAFRTRHYDLVFMDCQMPKLDGFGATEAIRRLESETNTFKTTPIIALTAFALDGDREKCMDAGMDDYLQKPFTDAALQDMLAKWINKNRSENPDAAKAPANSSVQQEYDLPIFSASAMERFERREREGKPGIIKKIVGGYIHQSDEYISELGNAAESVDLQSIAFASHALKSSSLLVGGEALSELCKEVEIASKSESLDNPQASVHELLECYQLTRDALMERYGSYLT